MRLIPMLWWQMALLTTLSVFMARTVFLGRPAHAFVARRGTRHCAPANPIANLGAMVGQYEDARMATRRKLFAPPLPAFSQSPLASIASPSRNLGAIHLRPLSTRLYSDLTSLSSSRAAATDGIAPAATSTPRHTTYSKIMEGLNDSQKQAVMQQDSAITRVVAGPGSGKTRVLTCRIAYLLQENARSRVLAVTFTRKAAGEMQQRLEKLLREAHGNDVVSVDSGSTRDALRRQQHRQQDQRYSSNVEVDGVTVENDAISDIRPPGLDRVTLGTFHSVCAKIMRSNGDYLHTLPTVRELVVGLRSPSDGSSDDNNGNVAFPVDNQFSIADQAEQMRILKECLVEKGIELSSYKDIKIMDVLNAVGEIREGYALNGKHPFLGKRSKQKNRPKWRIADTVYAEYRQKLFGNNAMDFDDLLFLTREMLMLNDEVRERLRRRYTHILVDEFQDTSLVQLDIVKMITSSSLFVVGDADQSIYSWRGAHVGSLADFAETFKHVLGEVQTFHLMENYRSTANIVKAAQKVINSGCGDESDNNKQNSALRQAMKPQRGKGPSPRVVACADGPAEAKFVVNSILDKIEDGTIQSDQTVAVIYRTNAQSRFFEEACVANSLPYVMRGASGGFYKRAEIKDCLCFLRWLVNGRDQGSMLRAFKTPPKGLGGVSVQQFEDYCEDVEQYFAQTYPTEPRPSPLDVLLWFTADQFEEGLQSHINSLLDGAPSPTTKLAKRAWTNFLSFSRQMRLIQDKSHTVTVDELLSFIIEEMDLQKHFNDISKSKVEFQDRMSNVEELLKAAQRYGTNGTALNGGDRDSDSDSDRGDDTTNVSQGGDGGNDDADEDDDDEIDMESGLISFMDDIALVSDIAGENADNENHEDRVVVNLMTIHASKGMEFDVVFLAGVEDGTLPNQMAILGADDSTPLEEEKRLCYVAMTRAKTELIMTWRKEVMIFLSNGPMKFTHKTMKRSRFLDSIMSTAPSAKGKSRRSTSASAGPRGATGMKRDAQRGGGTQDGHIRRWTSSSTDQPVVKKKKKKKKKKSTPVSESSQNSKSASPDCGQEAIGNFLRRADVSSSKLGIDRQDRPHANGTHSDYGGARKGHPDGGYNGAYNGSHNDGPRQRDASPTTHRSQTQDFSSQSRSESHSLSDPSRRRTMSASSAQQQHPQQPESSTSSPPPPKRRAQHKSTTKGPDEDYTYSYGSNQYPASASSASAHPRSSPGGSSNLPPTRDFSWLFPVGSDVVHTKRGKGIVLKPPPPSASPSAGTMVRVKFRNNTVVDIPVASKHLKLDLGLS